MLLILCNIDLFLLTLICLAGYDRPEYFMDVHRSVGLNEWFEVESGRDLDRIGLAGKGDRYVIWNIVVGNKKIDCCGIKYANLCHIKRHSLLLAEFVFHF